MEEKLKQLCVSAKLLRIGRQELHEKILEYLGSRRGAAAELARQLGVSAGYLGDISVRLSSGLVERLAALADGPERPALPDSWENRVLPVAEMLLVADRERAAEARYVRRPGVHLREILEQLGVPYTAMTCKRTARRLIAADWDRRQVRREDGRRWEYSPAERVRPCACGAPLMTEREFRDHIHCQFCGVLMNRWQRKRHKCGFPLPKRKGREVFRGSEPKTDPAAEQWQQRFRAADPDGRREMRAERARSRQAAGLPPE